MSQGCTSALLRRRRARTGGEETFEGGAGEERAGGWPRPNDSCLLAPLFPACFPHTRCRQRLALEDSCVRSLFYVPASAQAERLSKEGRTEEKKRSRSAPRGATYSARALRSVRLQPQCRSDCIAPLEPLRAGLCTAQAAVDKLTRFLAELS